MILAQIYVHSDGRWYGAFIALPFQGEHSPETIRLCVEREIRRADPPPFGDIPITGVTIGQIWRSQRESLIVPCGVNPQPAPVPLPLPLLPVG